MKKMMLFFVMLSIIISGCTSQSSTPTGNIVKNSQDLREVTLDIKNMYCASCASGIAYQLKQVPGVISAEIDYADGSGVVQYDSSKVSAEQIAAASDVYPASVVATSAVNH